MTTKIDNTKIMTDITEHFMAVYTRIGNVKELIVDNGLMTIEEFNSVSAKPLLEALENMEKALIETEIRTDGMITNAKNNHGEKGMEYLRYLMLKQKFEGGI